MSSFLQSASVASGTTTTSIGQAYTTANLTSGSTLFCVVFWTSSTITCTVADPTNGSWTAVGGPFQGADNNVGFRLQMFIFTGNTSTAKPTVTATFSSTLGSASAGIAIHEYSGAMVVEGSPAYNNVHIATFTTNTLTPTNDADMAFSFGFADNAATAVDAAFTQREQANWASNMTADDVTLTSGVGSAATYTNTGSDMTMGIVILTPQAAAGFANTAVPIVTGTLNVGSTLTVNPGTWTPTPGSYVYDWHRADDTSGTNDTEISGATGATYTLAAADSGKYLRAGVFPQP